MKPSPKTLCVGLALAALVSAPIAFAAVEAPATAESKADDKHNQEDGGLDGAMQALNGGMKRLNKAFEKADLGAVVTTAVEMQQAVQTAKTGTPEKAAAISDAKEKSAFMLGYRKQLITLQKSLLDLETAALDGKTDEAKKIFNETIAPMKKEGHSKYKD